MKNKLLDFSISGRVWVELSGKELTKAKRDLTFQVKKFHPKEPDPEPILAYEEKPLLGIGLPIAYGLQALQKAGSPWAAYFPLSNSAWKFRATGPGPDDSIFPNQTELFRKAWEDVQAYETSYLVAPTGSGKTALGLNILCQHGRTALVIVDRITVAKQWQTEALRLTSLEPDEIGLYYGEKKDWQGKSLVIAVGNSIARKLPRGMSENFDLVIWDEAHKFAARTFSKTLGKFKANKRIALSATPDRKDGLGKLVECFFGEPLEFIEAHALPVDVWPIVYQVDHKIQHFWRESGSVPMTLSRLSESKDRNRMLADMIFEGYRKGRNILAISDRTLQLSVIHWHLTTRLGVPEDRIGYLTRKKHIDGAEIAVKDQEIDETIKTAQIILSTYNMGKDAINIPRLDFGIELMPRASLTQALGRIRRPFKGKKQASWFTIRDAGLSFARKWYEARIREIKPTGATIREE